MLTNYVPQYFVKFYFINFKIKIELGRIRWRIIKFCLLKTDLSFTIFFNSTGKNTNLFQHFLNLVKVHNVF
jgi:hypothetical protein